MKTVKIVIEKTKDNYDAYAENVPGIYGGGATAGLVKQSIYEAIELFKKYNNPKNVPAVLKGDYRLAFRFNAESLLKYYKGIFTNSFLERFTGLNQKQIQNYASGKKRPGKTQLKKIETALRELGAELIAVEL